MSSGRILGALLAGLIGLAGVRAGYGQEPAVPSVLPPGTLTQSPAVSPMPQLVQPPVSYAVPQLVQPPVSSVVPATPTARPNPEANDVGKPTMMVKAMCVRVPTDFYARVGLVAKENDKDTSEQLCMKLTSREVRMLEASFAREKDVEVVCRPRLMMVDGKSSTMLTENPLTLVTALEAVTKDGATLYKPTMQTINVGDQLKLSPKLRADGETVAMQVEVSHSGLANGLAKVPVKIAGQPATGNVLQCVNYLQCSDQIAMVNIQQMVTNTTLTRGETVVLRGLVVKMEGEKAIEALWILTLEAIDSK